jgi:hypothetical protein
MTLFPYWLGLRNSGTSPEDGETIRREAGSAPVRLR